MVCRECSSRIEEADAGRFVDQEELRLSSKIMEHPIKKFEDLSNLVKEFQASVERARASLETGIAEAERTLSGDDARQLRELISRAEYVLGSKENAYNWLFTKEVPALGGRVPMNYAVEEEDGVEKVMRLIGQMEHGVFC